MEAVLAIVLDELVFCSIESELAIVDTVSETSDASTEVRWSLAIKVGIRHDIVEAEYYITQFSIAIWSHDADDAATEVGDTNLHAIGIGQGVEGGLLSVDFSYELLWIKT